MTHAMHERNHILLVGLVAVCLAGAGPSLSAQGDEPVLVRAGNVEVTAETFRARYVAYLLATGLQDAPSLRRTFLDDLVATRLLIDEARREGIAQEAAYEARQAQVRRKLLLEAYAHRVLFDTLAVREDEVQATFVRAHTQLKARHLYARTRAQAAVLYARLRAGEPFEALAREVFADPHLAQNGGSLGYFGFDEMDPAFEDAAYALEIGAVSEPVRTAQGYSIIQLEDRFTKPLLTELEYARRRPHLRAYVLRRKRQQARRDHVRRLTEELHVAFEDAALDALLGQIAGTGTLDGEEAFRRLLAAPLVAFGPPAQRRTWTVGDFRAHAGFTSEEQRAQVHTRADLVDFVQGLVARQVMMERAEALGLDAAPAFADALREAMDDFVLDHLRRRLDDAVAVPEDSVRRYFETAPPGEFAALAQVRVGEILVATKAEAAQLKQDLAYASFETLARQHTLRPGAREAGGDLGFLSAKQLGPLAEAVFGAAPGAVLGPLEWQGRYVLFQVGERRAGRLLGYDEAWPEIVEMLRYRYGRAHRRAVYDAIQARYRIDVDTELLYSMPLTDENRN